MAINIKLMALRLSMDTGCSPAKAEERVRYYIKFTALELLTHYNKKDHPYFFISWDDFRDPLRLMIKGVKFNVRDILQTYKERLFDIMVEGNNLNKKLTKVKLNYSLEDIILASGTPEELAAHVYAPYENMDVDLITLNMQSLEHYLLSVKAALDTAQANNSKQNYIDTLENNLNEATRIYMIGSAFNGTMPHVINESDFGRRYYKGPNLQTCPKIVRHAALGNCFEYDIESSALAWKLGYFKIIGKEAEENLIAPSTLELIDHKNAIRKTVAHDIFDTDDEWALDVVKEAITAIGFGAPTRSMGYMEKGRYKIPALSDIIKSPVKLQKFLDNAWVKEFTQEQKYMNQVILGYERLRGAEAQWRLVPDLLDKAGRVMPNKAMAYLYQHAEREIIEFIKREFEPYGVLLVVHDCVYTKHPVGSQTLADLRFQLKEFGAFFDISKHQHLAYKFDSDRDDHAARIQAEELRAQEYGRNVMGSKFAVTEKHAVSAPVITYNSDDHCNDGSGYNNSYTNYQAAYDPYLEDMNDDELSAYTNARRRVLQEEEQPDWVNHLLNK